MSDTIEPQWFKSTRSGSNGGNCVEVATNLLPTTGHIFVRDSKNPDVAPFKFTEGEWAAFIGGAKDGEFDL